MTLPLRKPKKPKTDSRWRSQSHCTWLRGFHCCVCGSATNVVVAHVRMGSGAGLSRKPDDWRAVPLCDGPFSGADGGQGCHDRQHNVGEPSFWRGVDIEALIDEFCRESPKAAEIRAIRGPRYG